MLMFIRMHKPGAPMHQCAGESIARALGLGPQAAARIQTQYAAQEATKTRVRAELNRRRPGDKSR